MWDDTVVGYLGRDTRGAKIEVVVPTAKISGSATQEVRLSENPSASPAVCFDPDTLYPYRTGEAARVVERRLGNGVKITTNVIVQVRKYFEITPDKRSNLIYKGRFSNFQFSEKFIDWLVVQLNKTPNLVAEMRRATQDSEQSLSRAIEKPGLRTQTETIGGATQAS